MPMIVEEAKLTALICMQWRTSWARKAFDTRHACNGALVHECARKALTSGWGSSTFYTGRD
eukprot:4820002-Amphidinium_carterae.1